MIEIIPAIDIINGRCVRLTEGDYENKTVYGDPLEMALMFEAAGFRRLHVVDLDGAAAGRLINTRIVENICTKTSLAVDFGGGIRSRDDIATLLSAGVRQFTAGSIAAGNRQLVLEWLEEFGAGRVILGADVRDGRVAVNGWKETVNLDIIEFIGGYLNDGIRTVICTDVSRDGTMSGPSVKLYERILRTFPGIDLIASGGVSGIDDVDALETIGVRSVIVGKALYENGLQFGLRSVAETGRQSKIKEQRASSTAGNPGTVAGKPQPRHRLTPGTLAGKPGDVDTTPESTGRLASGREEKFTPAVRIIPCLDVKDGRVVKGINFGGLRDAGDPVELARIYSDQGADELVFLDISATDEGRKTMAGMVRRVAGAVNIPFTVGGGIGSSDDVSLLLSSGADKVSVNSAAVRNPALISELARRFGSQCIVLAVDAGKQHDGSWRVYVNGGKVPVDLDLFDWVVRGVELGAGEILFTSIDNDGTGKGFANEALAKIAGLVDVPVIASGGAGEPRHFAEAVTEGKASALLAAGLFHYGKLTIPDLKEYLSSNNISVRLLK